MDDLVYGTSSRHYTFDKEDRPNLEIFFERNGFQVVPHEIFVCDLAHPREREVGGIRLAADRLYDFLPDSLHHVSVALHTERYHADVALVWNEEPSPDFHGELPEIGADLVEPLRYEARLLVRGLVEEGQAYVQVLSLDQFRLHRHLGER